MLRILIALLLVFSFSTQAYCIEKNYTRFRVKIKIPTTWIEQAKNYDYKKNCTSLLNELDTYLSPRKIDTSNSGMWGSYWNDCQSKCGYFMPLFADIDEEPGEEMICILGWEEDRPSMGVFKKIANTWYLLYLESFYMWYSMPDLHLFNTYSKNKTFYFRHLYNSGSSIYSDGYSFYKLIHHKVYHCLELVNGEHIDMWGMDVNQSAELNFNFDAISDEIGANYQYAFLLGGREGEDSSSYGLPVPVLKGYLDISYEWDSTRLAYKHHTYNNKTDTLIEKKVACLGDFGNDRLFVDAFQVEINDLLKTGTPLQKQLLRKLLKKVKRKK
jgi:hypothetical protein